MDWKSVGALNKGISSLAVKSSYSLQFVVKLKNLKTPLGYMLCGDNLMGGEMGVESKSGTGTLFWFTLLLDKPKVSQGRLEAPQG